MLDISKLVSGYGQSEVIHGLEMKAEKNEIVALLGRNGMGKSTLFKTLMGILPTRGGEVSVDGTSLNGMESHQRVGKGGVAYVPQGRMVFPALTVEENIRTGLHGGERSVPAEIYDLFPVLLEMRKRRAGNLSGGQQQQLAIARALVTKPKVLLLDEPTEGIQPSIIKDIARSLKEIRDMKGLTIVVSEQVLSFALDVADRILVIDRGRLVHECLAADTDTATVSRYLSV